MTTISSAALITVLTSSADNRPKNGCHGIMSTPSYHTRLFLCLAHIAAHVRNGGTVHAQTFEQCNDSLMALIACCVAPVAAADKIKIGYIATMSGPAASLG